MGIWIFNSLYIECSVVIVNCGWKMNFWDVSEWQDSVDSLQHVDDGKKATMTLSKETIGKVSPSQVRFISTP